MHEETDQTVSGSILVKLIKIKKKNGINIMPINKTGRTALAIGVCTVCWKLLEEKSQSAAQEFLIAAICLGCGITAGGSAMDHANHGRNIIAARRAEKVQQQQVQQQRPGESNRPAPGIRNQNLQAPGRGGAFVSIEIRSREIPRNPTGSRAAGIPRFRAMVEDRFPS